MSRPPRKASKNLEERLVKEPLFKIVKTGGVLRKEILTPPPDLEDEDVFYNTLLRGIDPEDLQSSSPSGFGRFNPQRQPSSSSRHLPEVREGKTGFSDYLDRHSKEGVLSSSSPETTAIQQRIISNYVKQLEQSDPTSFPEDWRSNPRLRRIIAQIIAEDLHISIEEVLEKL